MQQSSVERWAPVAGYEGRYEISDHGRFRSVTREFRRSDGRVVRVIGRLLALPFDSHGYHRVTVFSFPRTERPRYLAVHRMVLAAFAYKVGCEKLHVNHKDGVKTNNRLENLEWCTNAENRLHSYRVLGIRNPQAGKTGALHHLSKPVTARCIATGEERQYPGCSAASVDGFRGADVSACEACA